MKDINLLSLRQELLFEESLSFIFQTYTFYPTKASQTDFFPGIEYFTETGCNIVYTNLMDYKKPDIYLVKLVKIPPICNIN